METKQLEAQKADNRFADLNSLDVRIPPNLLMQYQGKPYVLKAGLEWKASQIWGVGNYTLLTDLVERTDERIVVKATLITPDKGMFINFGEVNKFNTNRLMFNNALHLAVTRAECRVLRMATACGYVAYEEIEGQSEGKDIPQSVDDGKGATPGQLEYLKSKKIAVKENLTQGEAKELIAESLKGKK